MSENITYKGITIILKTGQGKFQYPYSFYIKNGNNEMIYEGEEAYLNKEKCLLDAKKAIDNIEQERQI